MFLFNILFSLIMLPFTLIAMGMRLLGISTRLFLWPLKIFARHTVACLIIVAVVILYLALKKDPHAVDSVKSQAKPQQVRAAGNVPAVVVEPVAKREDGDSKFATDLYALMTDEERAYYSQTFYTTMNTTPDGKTNVWAHNNISGALRVDSSFQNKRGGTCRTFSEVLKVHAIEQQMTGTACVKADATWCKLKPNATTACNLGREAGMFDGITRAIGDLF